MSRTAPDRPTGPQHDDPTEATGRTKPFSSARVGLIGYGFAGRCFHAPLIQATGNLSLTAVASSDAAKVRAGLGDVAVFADPVAMIDSGLVDLVVIASPNLTHVPLATAAIAAGLHVVVDKPFTPTTEEARRLVRLAEERGVMLSVFHNRRWDSDYLAVLQAVRSGRLGRVTHFESRVDRFRPQVRDRWRDRDLPASGLWFDLGPHLVDQSLQLFGLPDRVVASVARQREGAVVDDWAHVILEHGQHRSLLHCSMLATGTPRFTVHGTRATAVKRGADQQESQLIAGMTPGCREWGQDPDPLLLLDHAGGQSEQPATGDQRQFYAGVAAHLRGKAPNPVPGIQAVAVMAVLEAAATSARLGRSVEPALSGAEREAWRSTMAPS